MRLNKENYLDEITAPRHGGRVDEISEERGIKPEDLLDFSANMNPLAPPSGLEDLVQEATGALEHYPDGRYKDFRRAVVDFLREEAGIRLKPRVVIPGNGSVEIFRLILQWIVSTGGESVLIPYSTFSEYELQSRLFGLEVSRVEYEEVLRYTEDELKDYDLVFLCNPNNPTGVLRDKDRLTQFVSRCREVETYVLLDEAFIELSRPEESLIPSVPSFSNLVVVRSLTKEFTIPGLRIGYGIVPVEMANNVEKLRPPWNLNTLASAVGSRFLRTEKELLLDSRNYLSGERSWLKDRLEDLGFSIYPSEANYLLFNAKPVKVRAGKLLDRCLEDHVLLRNADSFYGLDGWHVRIAVKRREENRKLVEALSRAILNHRPASE